MMQKLYQKSELALALTLIGIYVVISSILMSLPAWTSSVFHVLMSVAILLFILKNGHKEAYGLTLPKGSAKGYLFYLPLVVIISVNLWFGVKMEHSLPISIFQTISMLFVGFIEEIIFRGMLFQAIRKNSLKWAIIISSITFGAGHIVNLINGNAESILLNLCQIVYASAAGFLFVILFLKSASLIPCILTHSLVNALSVFSAPAPTLSGEILTAAALTLVSALYALYLAFSLPGRKK